MPRREYPKEFFVPLDPWGEDPATAEDRLRVRIEAAGGGVADFVLQYEAVIAGTVYPVVRYDCAHGQPHRDTLDAQGRNVEKFWLPPGLSNSAALQWADRDARANWRRYRDEFISRM